MSTTTAIPNPFVYGQVLIPGKPFCSRPQLESSVLEAAVHQQRIVLLGERRMGKSSLVEHTLTRADRVLVAVDLRGLDSVEDCIDRLLLRPTKKYADQKFFSGEGSGKPRSLCRNG